MTREPQIPKRNTEYFCFRSAHVFAPSCETPPKFIRMKSSRIRPACFATPPHKALRALFITRRTLPWAQIIKSVLNDGFRSKSPQVTSGPWHLSFFLSFLLFLFYFLLFFSGVGAILLALPARLSDAQKYNQTKNIVLKLPIFIFYFCLTRPCFILDLQKSRHWNGCFHEPGRVN